MKKNLYAILLMAAGLTLGACKGDDRSSEQPFKPTVENVNCEVIADSCRLTGRIVASPNSTLTGCGFIYGNDTLRRETVCDTVTMTFSAYTKQLQPGRYYAVSFASNRMGSASATDSMYFTIME